MKERYYQISLYNEKNPIISDSQSADENTDSIKTAIDNMFKRHIVMIDGEMFKISEYQRFIDRVSALCECDVNSLIEYVENRLSYIAPVINP